MIQLTNQGHYQIVSLSHDQGFQVILDQSDLMATIYNKIPKSGHYKMYKILDEPGIEDGLHLELSQSRRGWRGLVKLEYKLVATNELSIQTSKSKQTTLIM